MKSELYESQASNPSPSRQLSFLLSPKIKEHGIVIKQTRKSPQSLISVVATHSPEYQKVTPKIAVKFKPKVKNKKLDIYPQHLNYLN